MADAPWRCSQCGTVNEPVANACRTCGRWPSLFELEGSTIDAETVEARPQAEIYEPDAPEPVYVEPEVYDVGEPVDVEVDDVTPIDEEVEEPKPLWQRLASFVVPIGIVLYIIVSALVNSDSGG
jgi:hypothetical protein